jgi:hypothetical protein
MSIIKNTSLLRESDVKIVNTNCTNKECRQPLTQLFRQITNEDGEKVFTYDSILLCENPSCILKVDIRWIEANSHWKRRPEEYIYEEVDKEKISKNRILKTIAKLNEELGETIIARQHYDFLAKW